MNRSMAGRGSPDLTIEPMTRDDLPEVLAIEVSSFALPWTEEMFATDLAQGTLAEVLVGRLSSVGTPPPIAGYICVWVVSDELHVNNVAVHPRWRRRGVATALLQAALDHGRGGVPARRFWRSGPPTRRRKASTVSFGSRRLGSGSVTTRIRWRMRWS